MFDLQFNLKGDSVLTYTERYRSAFERGIWMEIGHENDKEIKYFIEVNRQAGLQVERDQKGYYRALVLKD
jgi:hypothetical protein